MKVKIQIKKPIIFFCYKRGWDFSNDKEFNVNKAHVWDNISIIMIKSCEKTIVTLLKLLFKSMLEVGTLLDHWKKSNVVPIDKKESKN